MKIASSYHFCPQCRFQIASDEYRNRYGEKLAHICD